MVDRYERRRFRKERLESATSSSATNRPDHETKGVSAHRKDDRRSILALSQHGEVADGRPSLKALVDDDVDDLILRDEHLRGLRGEEREVGRGVAGGEEETERGERSDGFCRRARDISSVAIETRRNIPGSPEMRLVLKST